ncbi:MAG: hypothetical protein AAFN77_02295 [Planctomycetota bacterium]
MHHTSLPEYSLDEAQELIKIHCGTLADTDDPRLTKGLLFSLRAWNDPLNVEAFHEVMACIKTLGPTWSQQMIPSRQISDLWGLIYLGGCYVNDPARIEHRSQYVLENIELGIESRWLDCIGYAVLVFLEGRDPDEAFSVYNAFINEFNS